MNTKSADLLRITALFLVVLLHVAASSFHDFHDSWIITVFYGSISRVCIPLFFMLSGALLLKKEEKIGVFFKKRAGKIIIPTIFWSVIYLYYRKYITGPASSSLDPIQILEGPTYYHLWFMYTIVTLYIATPLLRVFNLHAGKNLKWYVVIVWFLAYSGIPYLGAFMDNDIGFNLGFIPQYAGFMLLGSLLSEDLDKVKPAVSSLVFLTGSMLTFALTLWYSRQTGAPDEMFYAYLAPNVIWAATGLYLLLGKWGEKIPDKLGNAFKLLSNCTFGIYFVHVIVMNVILKRIFDHYYGMNLDNIYSIINIPLIAASSILISFMVILTMKKTPILRHVA